MKLISLTQGKFAQVDDDLFDELNKLKWQATRGWNTYYARHSMRQNNGVAIIMHRFVLELSGVRLNKLVVDHIDRDGLNNQIGNLRVATKSQNGMNRIVPSNNTSGYIGVYFNNQSQRWCARIKANKKYHFIGAFDTLEDAVYARNKKAIELHKSFAVVQ